MLLAVVAPVAKELLSGAVPSAASLIPGVDATNLATGCASSSYPSTRISNSSLFGENDGFSFRTLIQVGTTGYAFHRDVEPGNVFTNMFHTWDTTAATPTFIPHQITGTGNDLNNGFVSAATYNQPTDSFYFGTYFYSWGGSTVGFRSASIYKLDLGSYGVTPIVGKPDVNANNGKNCEEAVGYWANGLVDTTVFSVGGLSTDAAGTTLYFGSRCGGNRAGLIRSVDLTDSNYPATLRAGVGKSTHTQSMKDGSVLLNQETGGAWGSGSHPKTPNPDGGMTRTDVTNKLYFIDMKGNAAGVALRSMDLADAYYTVTTLFTFPDAVNGRWTGGSNTPAHRNMFDDVWSAGLSGTPHGELLLVQDETRTYLWKTHVDEASTPKFAMATENQHSEPVTASLMTSNNDAVWVATQPEYAGTRKMTLTRWDVDLFSVFPSMSDCTGNLSACPSACSGNGLCHRTASSTSASFKTCSCFQDDVQGHWTGSSCASCSAGYFGTSCVTACPDTTCNGHGTCDDGVTGTGTCTCEANYGGNSCDSTCPFNTETQQLCSNRGTCDVNTLTCACTGNFGGDSTCSACSDGFFYQSESDTCTSPCPCAHGSCAAGVCVCEEGWAGTLCDRRCGGAVANTGTVSNTDLTGGYTVVRKMFFHGSRVVLLGMTSQLPSGNFWSYDPEFSLVNTETISGVVGDAGAYISAAVSAFHFDGDSFYAGYMGDSVTEDAVPIYKISYATGVATHVSGATNTGRWGTDCDTAHASWDKNTATFFGTSGLELSEDGLTLYVFGRCNGMGGNGMLRSVDVSSGVVTLIAGEHGDNEYVKMVDGVGRFATTPNPYSAARFDGSIFFIDAEINQKPVLRKFDISSHRVVTLSALEDGTVGASTGALGSMMLQGTTAQFCLFNCNDGNLWSTWEMLDAGLTSVTSTPRGYLLLTDVTTSYLLDPTTGDVIEAMEESTATTGKVTASAMSEAGLLMTTSSYSLDRVRQQWGTLIISGGCAQHIDASSTILCDSAADRLSRETDVVVDDLSMRTMIQINSETAIGFARDPTKTQVVNSEMYVWSFVAADNKWSPTTSTITGLSGVNGFVETALMVGSEIFLGMHELNSRSNSNPEQAQQIYSFDYSTLAATGIAGATGYGEAGLACGVQNTNDVSATATTFWRVSGLAHVPTMRGRVLYVAGRCGAGAGTIRYIDDLDSNSKKVYFLAGKDEMVNDQVLADGQGVNAKTPNPDGLVHFGGKLYFADSTSNTNSPVLRSVDMSGNVVTLTVNPDNSGTYGYSMPLSALKLDGQVNEYCNGCDHAFNNRDLEDVWSTTATATPIPGHLLLSDHESVYLVDLNEQYARFVRNVGDDISAALVTSDGALWVATQDGSSNRRIEVDKYQISSCNTCSAGNPSACTDLCTSTVPPTVSSATLTQSTTLIPAASVYVPANSGTSGNTEELFVWSRPHASPTEPSGPGMTFISTPTPSSAGSLSSYIPHVMTGLPVASSAVPAFVQAAHYSSVHASIFLGFREMVTSSVASPDAMPIHKMTVGTPYGLTAFAGATGVANGGLECNERQSTRAGTTFFQTSGIAESTDGSAVYVLDRCGWGTAVLRSIRTVDDSDATLAENAVVHLAGFHQTGEGAQTLGPRDGIGSSVIIANPSGLVRAHNLYFLDSSKEEGATAVLRRYSFAGGSVSTVISAEIKGSVPAVWCDDCDRAAHLYSATSTGISSVSTNALLSSSSAGFLLIVDGKSVFRVDPQSNDPLNTQIASFPDAGDVASNKPFTTVCSAAPSNTITGPIIVLGVNLESGNNRMLEHYVPTVSLSSSCASTFNETAFAAQESLEITSISSTKESGASRTSTSTGLSIREMVIVSGVDGDDWVLGFTRDPSLGGNGVADQVLRWKASAPTWTDAAADFVQEAAPGFGGLSGWVESACVSGTTVYMGMSNYGQPNSAKSNAIYALDTVDWQVNHVVGVTDVGGNGVGCNSFYAANGKTGFSVWQALGMTMSAEGKNLMFSGRCSYQYGRIFSIDLDSPTHAVTTVAGRIGSYYYTGTVDGYSYTAKLNDPHSLVRVGAKYYFLDRNGGGDEQVGESRAIIRMYDSITGYVSTITVRGASSSNFGASTSLSTLTLNGAYGKMCNVYNAGCSRNWDIKSGGVIVDTWGTSLFSTPHGYLGIVDTGDVYLADTQSMYATLVVDRGVNISAAAITADGKLWTATQETTTSLGTKRFNLETSELVADRAGASSGVSPCVSASLTATWAYRGDSTFQSAELNFAFSSSHAYVIDKRRSFHRFALDDWTSSSTGPSSIETIESAINIREMVLNNAQTTLYSWSTTNTFEGQDRQLFSFDITSSPIATPIAMTTEGDSCTAGDVTTTSGIKAIYGGEVSADDSTVYLLDSGCSVIHSFSTQYPYTNTIVAGTGAKAYLQDGLGTAAGIYQPKGFARFGSKYYFTDLASDANAMRVLRVFDSNDNSIITLTATGSPDDAGVARAVPFALGLPEAVVNQGRSHENIVRIGGDSDNGAGQFALWSTGEHVHLLDTANSKSYNLNLGAVRSEDMRRAFVRGVNELWISRKVGGTWQLMKYDLTWNPAICTPPADANTVAISPIQAAAQGGELARNSSAGSFDPKKSESVHALKLHYLLLTALLFVLGMIISIFMVKQTNKQQETAAKTTAAAAGGECPSFAEYHVALSVFVPGHPTNRPIRVALLFATILGTFFSLAVLTAATGHVERKSGGVEFGLIILVCLLQPLIRIPFELIFSLARRGEETDNHQATIAGGGDQSSQELTDLDAPTAAPSAAADKANSTTKLQPLSTTVRFFLCAALAAIQCIVLVSLEHRSPPQEPVRDSSVFWHRAGVSFLLGFLLLETLVAIIKQRVVITTKSKTQTNVPSFALSSQWVVILGCCDALTTTTTAVPSATAAADASISETQPEEDKTSSPLPEEIL